MHEGTPMPPTAPNTALDSDADDVRQLAPAPPVPVRPERTSSVCIASPRVLPPQARCAVCGERDERVLRSVKLARERVVLCANDRVRLRASWVRAADVREARLLLLDVIE
jgi:hypothetical protein